MFTRLVCPHVWDCVVGWLRGRMGLGALHCLLGWQIVEGWCGYCNESVGLECLLQAAGVFALGDARVAPPRVSVDAQLEFCLAGLLVHCATAYCTCEAATGASMGPFSPRMRVVGGLMARLVTRYGLGVVLWAWM